MANKAEAVLNSLIGENSVFEGKFFIAGSLKIDGKFEGQVRTEEELIVGETGKVKTDIFAKRVTVAGVVVGNIEAEEEVKLLATGKVLGNISAPKVYIENGVVVVGEVKIHAGQQSNVDKMVIDAFETGPQIPNMRPDESEKERNTEPEQNEDNDNENGNGKGKNKNKSEKK